MKSIQPFIQKKVVVLHENATIQEAARAMSDHQIGCVVVADHRGHIVGIVTDRDIVSRGVDLLQGTNPITIGQIMSRNLVSVGDSASVKQVSLAMEEHGVRRIPVIQPLPGGMHFCVGIVTLDDLMASKSISMDRVSRIVRSQLRRKLISVQLPEASKKERDIFLDRLTTKLTPKLDFTRGELEQLTTLVLGALVRRLHHTGAVKFISTVPTFIQPPLLALPPGPDVSVDLTWLTSEVCRLFEVDESTANTVLIRFGSLLEEWCDEKTFEHVKAQLTNDLKGIFAQAKKAA